MPCLGILDIYIVIVYTNHCLGSLAQRSREYLVQRNDGLADFGLLTILNLMHHVHRQHPLAEDREELLLRGHKVV